MDLIADLLKACSKRWQHSRKRTHSSPNEETGEVNKITKTKKPSKERDYDGLQDQGGSQKETRVRKRLKISTVKQEDSGAVTLILGMP